MNISSSAFGNIASQTGTAFNPYYSYTGREYDAESGLYYYRARYYDPSIGRFLQEDPIGLY
ncbi:MAG: RHS repeat-associated core domain-containing protein, partial [Candidatus Dadabacteria bacterium]|nr:RHS repeat-associated core domain-containing protein [Candidatus Dadabacteria bacterium]